MNIFANINNQRNLLGKVWRTQFSTDISVKNLFEDYS